MKGFVKNRWFLILMLLPDFGLVLAANIEPENNAVKVGLSVVKRVQVDYFLLTRGQPLDFKLSTVSDTGAWLRVYTRVWLSKDDKDDERRYVISFLSPDSSQRFALKTSISASTFGPGEQRVGRWRSFFVRIKPGIERFRLVLDSAPRDTVGIRFSFQAPRRWERVSLSGLKKLTLVKENHGSEQLEGIFYQIHSNQPYEFELNGPCWVRMRTRLNFDPTMEGNQAFILKVEKKGMVIERTLRSKKETGMYYKELADVVAGAERRVSFELADGVHKLKVIITGTVARSGAIMVERLIPEKYE